MSFDREVSNDLFDNITEFINNELHGRMDYSDYCKLHDYVCRLYDSFSEVDAQLAEAQAKAEQLRAVRDAAEAIEYGLSNNDTCKCEWCTVSRNLRQALSQVKAEKQDGWEVKPAKSGAGFIVKHIQVKTGGE